MKIFTVCLLMLVFGVAGCEKKTPQPVEEADQAEQEFGVIDNTKGPDHIEEVLKIWIEGNKDWAVAELLEIKWDKQANFSNESIFNLGDQEYKSLPSSKKDELKNTCRDGINLLPNYVVELGREAVAAGDVEKAKLYFQAVCNFGEFLRENPNEMLQFYGQAPIMTESSQELDKLK